MNHYKIMESYYSKGFNTCVWPNMLRQNCLPFSLLAHRFVARKDREARVVIGRLLPHGTSLNDESKNDVLNFHSNVWLDFKPYFHAWIRLSNNTVYDVIGPKLQDEITQKAISEYHYFNAKRALESGYVHQEIITERSDVSKFYRRLRLGQIFQWQHKNIEKILDSEIQRKLNASWRYTSNA